MVGAHHPVTPSIHHPVFARVFERVSAGGERAGQAEHRRALLAGLQGLVSAFDAGVASLVLCSVDDQRRSLRELHRIIRPAGELRFYEHVRSTDRFPFRPCRVALPATPHVLGRASRT